MRVLQVVEATVFGVRTHVQTLVTGLHRRCYQTFVACPPRRRASFGNEQFVRYLTEAGVPVLPVAMQRAINPIADGLALMELTNIIRRGQYDLVHTHSSKAGILGRVAARIAGHVPVIYSPHGLFFLGDHGPVKRRIYCGAEQAAGRLCDRIIASSPSERDVVLANRLIAPDKVVCIQHGIPIPTLPSSSDRTAQRAALGLPADVPVIGTLARMVAQKNPLLFVDAAASVAKSYPQARFMWCGDGELRAAAEARAHKHGIAAQCHFIGYREDAQAILPALDLFWLTSDYEGLPYAVMEAMAAGLPVVATDVVGSHDLLDGAVGVLIPPRNPHALAQATVALLSDPARAQALGQAGRARILERFTVDRMLDQIIQLYETLITERHAETKASSISS
jgi:glycosyltransferase involved in cell wall biosynthesis